MGTQTTANETLAALIDVDDEQQVFSALGTAVRTLLPGTYVIIDSLTPDGEALTVAALFGFSSFLEKARRILPRDPFDMEFPLSRMSARLSEIYRTGTLCRIEGSISEISMGTLSSAKGRALEVLLGVREVWLGGFAVQGRHYGGLVILVPRGQQMEHVEVIEGFLRQATLAVGRLRAEAELREKTAELEYFFASSMGLHSIVETSGRVRRVNGRWEDVLGYSVAELVGSAYFDLVHPDDVEVTRHAVARPTSHDSAESFVNRCRAKDGSYRSLEWSVLRVGELVYATARDVTQHLADEEARRSVEERYRFIAENTGDVIWILDLARMRYIYVSPSVERVRGFTPAEAMDQPMDQSITPEAMGTIMQLLPARMAAFDGGDERARVQTHRMDQTRKDGSAVPTEVTTTLLTDADGTVSRILGVSRDISERLKAAEAVERSEEMMRLALDHLPGGAYIVDDQDRFLFMNRRLLKEMRLGSADVVGRPVGEVMPAADAATFAEEARLPRQSGRAFHTERPGFGHRKSRWIAATKYVIPREDGGDLLGGYSIDVSQQHQLELALRALNTELEQRVQDRTGELESAISELETLSYSIAHDLRSPLRAVNGYATIMLEDHGDTIGEDGRHMCESVMENARRMGDLIDDLLAYARLGRDRLAIECVDMSELAGAAFAEIVTEEQSEAIRFEVGELAPARGDATMLRQAWVNLIDNAVKFSAERSEPTIEVGCEPGARETVYWVRDNGAGFDMQYYAKLFRVFERLHGPEFAGSGVGLPIVRRAVEAHGGRVWAESSPGEGATFSFALPIVSSDEGGA